MKPKPLNQLIEYVCDRFTSWESPMLDKADGAKWAVACGRNEKEAWRFDVLVYMPMDLATMMTKAKEAK